MNTRTLLTLVLWLTFSAVSAQTNVPALITSNQTWTAAGNPYIVAQNCYLDSGVTLTALSFILLPCSSGIFLGN